MLRVNNLSLKVCPLRTLLNNSTNNHLCTQHLVWKVNSLCNNHLLILHKCHRFKDTHPNSKIPLSNNNQRKVSSYQDSKCLDSPCQVNQCPGNKCLSSNHQLVVHRCHRFKDTHHNSKILLSNNNLCQDSQCPDNQCLSSNHQLILHKCPQ
jgi:hypothetical protein